MTKTKPKLECKNLFDVLKNVTDIKDESGLGSDKYNSYMINRFLSMRLSHVQYAALLNRLWDIPKEYQEIFAFHLIPKGRVFFKYIKKNTDGRDYKDQKDQLMTEHQCSERKAEEMINFYNLLRNKKNGF